MTAEKINKHNKFYFLHIPKTGGRYFKKISVSPLKLICKQTQKDLEFLISNDHNGWKPEIDDSTYVVSIVRDPVKLACSWYMHFGNSGKNSHINLNTEAGLQRAKNGLLVFLNDTNWLHNFQSKNLTKHYKYSNDSTLMNYEDVDVDMLYENLERIDFLFTQDYLESNALDVCHRVFNDNGESFLGLELQENNDFRQPKSELLYNCLSKEEIEKIRSYFKLDMDIYNLVRNKEII
jgi:hypothetical protein